MTSGKSKVAIDLICNYQEVFKKVLVVCPASVIDVWAGNDDRKGQFEIHAVPEVFKKLVICPVKGTSLEKKTKAAELARFNAAQLNKQFIAVINYESAWREPFASWAKEVGFDLVVLDEIHRIKSPGGKASKFFGQLARTVKYRIGLTGTPLPHALVSSAKVLTPYGWIKIGKLRKDWLVIGRDGRPTKVVGVWPQGQKDLYTVKFCDGSETICTGDHLWNVNSRGRRSRGIEDLVIKTDELSLPRPLPNSNNKSRKGCVSSLFDKHGAPRWSIPLVEPVLFDLQHKLPIHPYLLGVLLGDGHIGHNIDFTTADEEIVNTVKQFLPNGLQLTKGHQNGMASRYRITSGKKGGSLKGNTRGPAPNPLIEKLEKLKLNGSRSHNKFIPAQYLYSDINDRISLLRGLCDTDGSSYGSTSKFITTSRQLAYDVTFLIRSLGGLVKTSIEDKKNTKLPNGKTVNGRLQYHLFFRMKINPFCLSRKASKFTSPWRNISRNIIDIAPCGIGDATCITVEAKDGLFVTEDFIVTHNSPLDIYGQYRFLDPGIFGTSFTKFRSDYAVMGGFQGHQIVSYRNADMLHDKMFLVAHRVMSKDVFDLPKFQSEIRTCELSGSERKTYHEMDINFCAEVANGEVTAANAMVKLLRLQEITSGYLDKQPVGDSKKKLLADVLEDFDVKEPIVVFARFTNDLRAIQEVAESQGRKYGELSGHANELSQWQIGNKDVLGVQIKSGREGVDFTRARYSIYYSLGFSLGDYEQSIKRLDRPGQLREGMYIHLLAKDTVDYKVMEALEKRQEVVASVLDQYRGIDSDDVPDMDEPDDASVSANIAG